MPGCAKIKAQDSIKRHKLITVQEELIELIPALKDEDASALLQLIRSMPGIRGTVPVYDSQQDQMAGFYRGTSITDDASQLEDLLYEDSTPAKP